MFAHGMFIFAKMHLYPMRKLHFGMYKDEIDNPPRVSCVRVTWKFLCVDITKCCCIDGKNSIDIYLR